MCGVEIAVVLLCFVFTLPSHWIFTIPRVTFGFIRMAHALRLFHTAGTPVETHSSARRLAGLAQAHEIVEQMLPQVFRTRRRLVIDYADKCYIRVRAPRVVVRLDAVTCTLNFHAHQRWRLARCSDPVPSIGHYPWVSD